MAYSTFCSASSFRLHGVQLRYDAQTVAAQFHGLELNNVGALVHHRARHRRG